MHPQDPSGPENGFSAPSPALGNALTLLQNARNAAIELKLDPWEFAVGLPMLVTVGLSVMDVRQLLADGLAECRPELTPSDSGQRSFDAVADRPLTGRSCFVLTPAGERYLLSRNGHSAVGEATDRMIPRWDRETRQLWFAGRLVKVYCRPAESQETILMAFEEDGWPARIDDPLPRVPGVHSIDRLHEAVRRLNRSQLSRLLLFRRDGSGTGITWKRLAEPCAATEIAAPKPHFGFGINRLESWS
jgi:hypothetical protein